MTEDLEIILTQLGERAKRLSKLCTMSVTNFRASEIEKELGEVRIWEELLVNSQRIEEENIQDYFVAHFPTVEKVSQRKVFKVS